METIFSPVVRSKCLQAPTGSAGLRASLGRWVLLLCVVMAGLLLGCEPERPAVAPADPNSWPQLQRDAARSGHAPTSVKPPYRARWVWFGPDWVLRNRNSEDGDLWKDDLTSREGHSYRMPQAVDFSFAGGMQPIVEGGRVFVADMQGNVYGIDFDTGETLWTARQPGGSMFSGAASEGQVAFASVYGFVTSWDVETGEQLWQKDTGTSITHAPVLADGSLFVANHGGEVIRLDAATGKIAWRRQVGAPVYGGLCVSDGRVYLGNEAVEALALDAASGEILARRTVNGQGFRLTWPVAAGDRVIFTTFALVHGSEYINDPIFSGKEDPGWEPELESIHKDYLEEQQALREWLTSEEGCGFETTYALDKRTLSKDYIVAVGATDGCGMPPNPPVLSDAGRPILWWATAHPTLGPEGVFGSNFGMDLSYLDLETGLREVIVAPKNPKVRAEVDNLFGLTSGNGMLYARQNFRGTYAVDLSAGRKHWISALYRHRDGGDWPAPVNYAQGQRERERTWPDDLIRLPEHPGGRMKGRVGPTVVAERLLFTEHFGLTCVEHERKDR